MSLIDYSPKATAWAIRCEPDTLRAWRRLGLFDGLGERKGKGHRFTTSDIARLSLAAFLARNGASLREAFDIVSKRGPIMDTVAASLRNNATISDDESYYLTFVINNDVDAFPDSVTGAPIEKIAFDEAPIGALQVNVSRLIRKALDRLQGYERASAEYV